MRLRWGSVRVLAAAGALLLAAGCSGDGAAGPEPDAPARGGTAVLGSISDVDSWNEYVSQQVLAQELLRRIYLRLAQDTGAGIESPDAFEPLLAESWSFGDDGRSLTFRLRKTTWSDGVPVTASDVRFTWRAQTSEHVPWIGADSKSRITDVEAVDDRTVTFRFDGAYPYRFADAVEGGILPEHVFGEVPFEEWATHDWSDISVGSGPFVLERHTPQQEIVLVRNPWYFREGLPYLDRVVVRILPDALSLTTQLRAGDLDWLDHVSPRDAATFRDDPERGVTIVPFPAPKYDFLGWNGTRPPLDDPEVRRALTLAIDRGALVDELLYGFGRVAKAPVPSGWWGAADTFAAWPYDPDEARRLLAAHGFAVRRADGTTGPGRPLRLELLTNAGNTLRADTLVKIQEQLGRVGVAADVRSLEMKTMRQQVMSGSYDGWLGGWTFAGKVDLRSLFASDRRPPEGLNVVGYASPEVDAQLDRLDAADTWQAMRAPLAAIEERIHRDQPYTFLFEPDGLIAHGPRLRNVTVDVPADPLARLERFWVADGP